MPGIFCPVFILVLGRGKVKEAGNAVGAILSESEASRVCYWRLMPVTLTLRAAMASFA